MATAGYFLDEKPPVGILITQAVGITASAFLVGQNAALSYASVPAILQAPAPLAARQWKKMFTTARKVGPTCAIIGMLATGYLAYREDPSSAPFKLNLAAAILLPSIVPYTLAFIQPTNKALLAKVDSLATTELTDKAAEAGVSSGETVHALIDKWATLNLGRVLLTGAGTILALWAALDKREVVGFKDIAFSTGANRFG
ncbi:hypothetical protein K469DRAFT_710979 [Zopfia rhizophila CBS 207.26]|uniref:DUF1772-domain-containing protein n=1 Tax=Zopfia rhizophila CBS 207.26 TaxID=1314779 RepID=A0A6A6DTL4_9PEZI|nr:hypothetical protein K469DRAFT_710979 [Zopfia rhizophila CBS 207.26]